MTESTTDIEREMRDGPAKEIVAAILSAFGEKEADPAALAEVTQSLMAAFTVLGLEASNQTAVLIRDQLRGHGERFTGSGRTVHGECFNLAAHMIDQVFVIPSRQAIDRSRAAAGRPTTDTPRQG